MIKTYDWIIRANRNPELKKKIECALACDKPVALVIDDTFNISFDPKNQMATVHAISEKCIRKHKIIPKKITYYFIKEAINGNFDACPEENIFDAEE